jgi:transcriptional regulator with GAF, ATPase, and Fis domain
MEIIRELVHQGFRVLAVASGCSVWPLAMRCLILLAGAQAVLDCKESGFSGKLAHLLTEAIAKESVRFAEIGSTRAAMQALGVAGASPAMMDVFRLALRAGPLSDVSVLLSGETGTGKELLARALHQLDPKRKSGPFVAFNCAALQATLAEAELFGHKRGAFTGAERDSLGLFRRADQGVLFLDEIGELDLALQAKLLRVLQDCHVLAVGDDRDVKVNLRVIAATNRELEAMVGQGRFRADLYHRLNVIAIRIPPLRERREDIAPLAEHFVAKHSALLGLQPIPLAPEFVAALTGLSLPGNGRELENVIRRALVNCTGRNSLGLCDLSREYLSELSREVNGLELVPITPSPGVPSAIDILEAYRWDLASCLEHYERLLLEAALVSSGGNQTRAGQMLGITPRTIYNKLRKFGICG